LARAQDQRDLEPTVPFVVKVTLNDGSEDGCLDEPRGDSTPLA
jgi:hypothetical protein